MAKRQYDMTARAAKAAETKDRIGASFITLYRERPLEEVTLDDVAARAKTTVQTILRVFGSKEQLIRAALTRTASQGEPIKHTAPGDVRAAVHAIFDIYETIGDFILAELAQEHRSSAVRISVEAGRENHALWVRTAFAPQLAAKRGSARTQIFNTLMVATDIYVWKILRRDLALKRDAAEASVRAIIAGVNDAEATNGTNSLAGCQSTGRPRSIQGFRTNRPCGPK